MSARSQERLPEWASDTGASEWHDEGYLVWGYSEERGDWYFISSEYELEEAKVEADELLAKWDDVVRVSVERRDPFKEVYAKPPPVDENPSTMGSDDFVAAVREKADLGVGYLVTDTRNQFNDQYDSAHLTFVNVPKDESGGVVFFNNRLLMFVDGFGKEKNEPPPKGKVKFRLGAAELLPRDMRPRGKTSSPERMVDYVANIITEASKLPTEWPPGSSRAANPTPVSANDLARKLKF